jgi:hypothetical protein
MSINSASAAAQGLMRRGPDFLAALIFLAAALGAMAWQAETPGAVTVEIIQDSAR